MDEAQQALARKRPPLLYLTESAVLLLVAAGLVIVIDSDHFRVDPADPFHQAIRWWLFGLLVAYFVGAVPILALCHFSRTPRRVWRGGLVGLAIGLIGIGYVLTLPSVAFHGLLRGRDWIELEIIQTGCGLILAVITMGVVALAGSLDKFRDWSR